MFKDLKVIKLIVIVGLLLAILFKIDFLQKSVYQLYTDKHSYEKNDQIKIYATSKAKYPIFSKTSLTDLQGNKIQEIELDLSYSQKEPEDVLLKGDESEKFIDFRLSTEMNSGIYLIAHKYPILITDNNLSDVTIVYPAMNNLINQKVEERTAITLKYEKTSFNRGVEIDDYTLGMKPVFEYIKTHCTVNYISDLDIENYKKIENTNNLVIYGKSGFWTPKMKSNLKKFITNGGNVLFICSYALNNVCWYDESNNAVTLYDKTRANAIESWLGYNGDDPRFVIGATYLFGGTSDHSEYNIIDKSHPIFNGINQLSLTSDLYNSSSVIWNDNIPEIDTRDTLFYSQKILAFNKSITPYGDNGVKGIFEHQPDTTSGKIINLGSEDWCLKEDKTLIINSINYLLK